jgi:hypothetical protein
MPLLIDFMTVLDLAAAGILILVVVAGGLPRR